MIFIFLCSVSCLLATASSQQICGLRGENCICGPTLLPCACKPEICPFGCVCTCAGFQSIVSGGPCTCRDLQCSSTPKSNGQQTGFNQAFGQQGRTEGNGGFNPFIGVPSSSGFGGSDLSGSLGQGGAGAFNPFAQGGQGAQLGGQGRGQEGIVIIGGGHGGNAVGGRGNFAGQEESGFAGQAVNSGGSRQTLGSQGQGSSRTNFGRQEVQRFGQSNLGSQGSFGEQGGSSGIEFGRQEVEQGQGFNQANPLGQAGGNVFAGRETQGSEVFNANTQECYNPTSGATLRGVQCLCVSLLRTTSLVCSGRQICQVSRTGVTCNVPGRPAAQGCINCSGGSNFIRPLSFDSTSDNQTEEQPMPTE